jgi:beta-aspartyl-peptidase (threonine type)
LSSDNFIFKEIKEEGMKKFALLFVVPLVLSPQLSFDSQKIQNEIQTILNRQLELWNETNIDGFMEFYWKSEHLTFQSGNKRLQGWEQLLSMYKKSYSGENTGQLEFKDISIKALSHNHAYVLGRWKVIQKASSKEGLFTLIFKRMPEGWRVIHDHTS